MKLDVVLPTYNSEEVLPYTLQALVGQTIPSGWQARVIVSDDGSHNNPDVLVAEYEWRSPWRRPLVLQNEHAGAAVARNAGIASSDADVVLLLGADIVLRPGALASHCAFHAANPGISQAALGMVVWDPRLHPTPLTEWMVHGGPQNDFDALLGADKADPAHFFYGSHVSVKRELLVAYPFPVGYQQYGWEDFDLGRILKAQGLELTVLHGALGLHRHAYTAADIRLRQQHVGRSAHIYAGRYPDDSIFPAHRRSRYIKLAVCSLPGIRWVTWQAVAHLGRRYTLPHLFLLATAAEFWWGWYKGEGEKKKTEKA